MVEVYFFHFTTYFVSRTLLNLHTINGICLRFCFCFKFDILTLLTKNFLQKEDEALHEMFRSRFTSFSHVPFSLLDSLLFTLLEFYFLFLLADDITHCYIGGSAP